MFSYLYKIHQDCLGLESWSWLNFVKGKFALCVAKALRGKYCVVCRAVENPEEIKEEHLSGIELTVSPIY